MANLKHYENVWAALEDDPVKAENMKLRSMLIVAITERITAQGLNQPEAARRLNITQPRVNALINGKIEQFRLDSLVNLAHQLGLQVSMQIAA